MKDDNDDDDDDDDDLHSTNAPYSIISSITNAIKYYELKSR
jgi:hypothetical protein